MSQKPPNKKKKNELTRPGNGFADSGQTQCLEKTPTSSNIPCFRPKTMVTFETNKHVDVLTFFSKTRLYIFDKTKLKLFWHVFDIKMFNQRFVAINPALCFGPSDALDALDALGFGLGLVTGAATCAGLRRFSLQTQRYCEKSFYVSDLSIETCVKIICSTVRLHADVHRSSN